MTLVVEPAQIARVAAAIAAAPLATFDLEFLSQDRLVPTLCLVQVSWLPAHVPLDATAAAIVAAEPMIALLDPLAVDVRPVFEALQAHPCVVAHAPRQDLGLVATRFGLALPRVADTQMMAAFAGLGDQVGLATLAGELLGVALGKEQQWTDWARRPLSDAQLAYATADVRHLPGMFALLRERLGARLPWALAESALVAADAVAAAAVTPATAWQQLGGLRGLDARALAAAVALAAWRQRVAVELDRPLGQVLGDKVLIDLARTRPDSPGAVRAARGMSPLARQRADDLLAALADARPGAIPLVAAGRPATPRAQRWAEILLAIVQLVADHTGVAARLLATRADAEALARAVDEGGLAAAAALPAFTTWRAEVLGPAWRGFLDGSLFLAGDPASPAGITLRTRDGVDVATLTPPTS